MSSKLNTCVSEIRSLVGHDSFVSDRKFPLDFLNARMTYIPGTLINFPRIPVYDMDYIVFTDMLM